MKPNTEGRGETPTCPQYHSPMNSSMSRQNPDLPSESKRHKKIPMIDVERRKQRKLENLAPHNPNPYKIPSQYLDPPSGNSTPQPPTATTTTNITATITSRTATTTAAASLTAPAPTQEEATKRGTPLSRSQADHTFNQNPRPSSSSST